MAGPFTDAPNLYADSRIEQIYELLVWKWKQWHWRPPHDGQAAPIGSAAPAAPRSPTVPAPI